jgi:hypothetical protein
MVMLFGHATNTGGYIPSGHAVLDGNSLKIKLANGHYYRMEVDQFKVMIVVLSVINERTTKKAVTIGP